MRLRHFKAYAVIAAALSMLSVLNAKDIDRTKHKGQNKVQARTFAINDLQRNTISKVEFFTTNYGIFGLNVASNQGGGRWPRGSVNQYVFGGGVWFGAVKGRVRHDSATGKDTTLFRKMSVISYDPNSGSSFMSPGRIEDGDLMVETDDARKMYRTYLSTDFNSNGTPRNAADGPNWCVWDNRPKTDTLSRDMFRKDVSRYHGSYLYNTQQRTSDSMPQWDDGKHKGPVVISGEDIFSTYKDTDLRNYPDGADISSSFGYPLRLQYEQTIYSWGYGEYENFIFIAYNVINRSSDSLLKCWMAPAYDFDIGPITGGAGAIASNDRVNYYSQDTTLNLAFQWSETGNNAPEKGKGFGYIGMDFLESPAVDPSTRYIRHDKAYYANNEQLGLQTFRNWIIANDPTNDINRYDFMSLGVREGDAAAGDKRFLMATGPFNMAPGDTARVVIGMIFASPGRGGEATGDSVDLSDLVRRDKFAQAVYDNAFATPVPPDICQTTWAPLNNAVIVKWDSTSENSIDKQERGMDFMGYRLYRARVSNLDTFSVDQMVPNATYTSGRGPFGWKQIAQWECPSAWAVSTLTADSTKLTSPHFPSIQIIRDANALSAYRQWYGGFYTSAVASDKKAFLVRRIPSSAAPWASFWTAILPKSPQSGPALYDTLTLGILKLLPNADSLVRGNADSVGFILKQSLVSKATITWMYDDFENSSMFRSQVSKFMDSVTNHHTYVDYGDDNGDGIITTDADLTKTEKLINNVDYYYRLLAYDEGDYFQRTPVKLNSGVDKVNQQQTFPLGQPAQRDAKTTQVAYDSSDLGGLYNFRLLIGDQQRFNELYANHKIQLQFTSDPLAFNGVYAVVDSVYDVANLNILEGVYSHNMRVMDLTTNTVLGNYNIFYEPQDCNFSNLFSECSVLFMGPALSKLNQDSIRNDVSSFANPFNTNIQTRYGSFSTDRVCSAPNRFINGAMGIAFDFAIQQFGGYLRPFAMKKTASSSDAQLSFLPYDPSPNLLLQRTRLNGTAAKYETYNNGPGHWQVEFLPGGTETVTSKYLHRNADKTVDTATANFTEVSYLNMRITNVYSFKRFDAALNDSVVVQRKTEVTHATQSLPASIPPSTINGSPTASEFPSPILVPIGSYNISANGWINGRYDASNMSVKESGAIGNAEGRRYQALELNTGRPVGQGRYYLSKEQNGNTLDFAHFLLINGAQYLIDYSAKGGRQGLSVGRAGRLYDRLYDPNDSTKPYIPQTDFKAGDKFEIWDFGGAFGLPKDGSTVTFTVGPSAIPTDNSGNQQVTEDDLSQILVVPNPYVISHIGQKSSYDAKIYFTHLPKVCTIKVYTINGDLINTINHVDTDGTTRHGMDIWDLLSSNRQRSASQGLFAVIETPNGAKVIKKFAVVVGGARLVK